MRVAIIGAGFTGLAAAWRLLEKGHQVTIFEAESLPGGLAAGFKPKEWLWPLEKHYHHIFESDRAIRDFASELDYKITFKDTATSTLTLRGIFPLDSPTALMMFSGLDLMAKLRTAAVLGYLRLTPFWKPLEKVPAKKFLMRWMGAKAWGVLWHDLFVKKFGQDYSKVPASWFWARIKKRSKRLGYPQAGFQGFAERAIKLIEKKGGICLFNTSINRISRKRSEIILQALPNKEFHFDRVICTLPSPIFIRLTPGLPASYRKKLLELKGRGAITLILRLRRNLLNKIYWLNVGEGNFPFLAVVEHTNLVGSANYGKEKIVYIGNYLDSGHKYFQMGKEELLKEFFPYLTRINPDFRIGWVKQSEVFKTGFAQPLVTLNYSKKLPPLATPIKGVYLANIQQVYPWDRGTNYAVELGQKVAELID